MPWMIILLFFYPPFTHYNLHVLLFPLYTIITVTRALTYIDTHTDTYTHTATRVFRLQVMSDQYFWQFCKIYWPDSADTDFYQPPLLMWSEVLMKRKVAFLRSVLWTWWKNGNPSLWPNSYVWLIYLVHARYMTYVWSICRTYEICHTYEIWLLSRTYEIQSYVWDIVVRKILFLSRTYEI